jgi:hypothetical protein
MAIFFIHAGKPPESGTLTKKGVRTLLPLIKKQASPNTNSETSENKNPTPYFGMQPDIAIVLYTRFA